SRGERLVIQAEDGIRDDLVTGVQTCALPISRRGGASGSSRPANEPTFQSWPHLGASRTSCFQRRRPASSPPDGPLTLRAQPSMEIGRASCRDRVWVWVVGSGVGGEKRRRYMR